MATAPKAPALFEIRALSDDLHLLALHVVKTVGDGTGYADPDAARLGYKDALRMVTWHAMRVALEQLTLTVWSRCSPHRDAKAGTNRAG